MTRHRNRDYSTGRVTMSFTLGGVPNGTYPHDLLVTTESMQDEITPGFRKVARSGGIVNNPLEYDKTVSTRAPGGSYYAVRKTNGQISQSVGYGSLTHVYKLGGVSAPSLTYPSVLDQDLIHEAKVKALSGIDKSSADLTEDVFTLGQTAEFLRNPFGALLELTTRWKKTHGTLRARKKGLERAKAIADSYFEFQYGARPLINSIDAILTELSTPKKVSGSYQTSRGTTTQTVTVPRRKVTSVGNSTFRHVVGGSRKFDYKAVCFYRTANPVIDWRKRWGLRDKDLARVAWELIPYSFMFDHFVNIGASIAAIANLADPSLEIIGGCVVTRTLTTSTESLVEQVNSAWTISIVPDTVTNVTFAMDRSEWMPTVTDALPVVNSAFGRVRDDYRYLAEIAGLIIQRMR